MIEQFVRIGNILDVEQLHHGIALGVKILVHIFQDTLDAYLTAVTNGPDAVELQALADGTLQDKDGRSTAARDEVDTLGVQLRNGLREDGVMPARQQP